jgi:colicin import membrane protein
MTAFHLRHRADPLRPPEAPGLGRGFGFAVLAHALLVLALSASVQWRTKTLPAFEAELWSAVPQAAAPKEVEPPPQPAPEPKLTPKPTPPAEDLQAQRDAEIAIAKARELKKKQDDEAERKKQQALKEQKDKAERDKQDKLEKQKQDKLDKAAKDAEAKREAQRQENLRRIQGMAGASGGPNATGSALKSSGPSSTYGGRIVAAVRPNIIYDLGAANPVAEVEVRAAADGSIIGKKLLKPSGDAEWDKAVLRAIDKTERLPRDVDGTVPSAIVITFRPRD